MTRLVAPSRVAARCGPRRCVATQSQKNTETASANQRHPITEGGGLNQAVPNNGPRLKPTKCTTVESQDGSIVSVPHPPVEPRARARRQSPRYVSIFMKVTRVASEAGRTRRHAVTDQNMGWSGVFHRGDTEAHWSSDPDGASGQSRPKHSTSPKEHVRRSERQGQSVRSTPGLLKRLAYAEALGRSRSTRQAVVRVVVPAGPGTVTLGRSPCNVRSEQDFIKSN